MNVKKTKRNKALYKIRKFCALWEKKIPMKITGQKHICVFYNRSISSDNQGYILMIFQILSPHVFSLKMFQYTGRQFFN